MNTARYMSAADKTKANRIARNKLEREDAQVTISWMMLLGLVVAIISIIYYRSNDDMRALIMTASVVSIIYYLILMKALRVKRSAYSIGYCIFVELVAIGAAFFAAVSLFPLIFFVTGMATSHPSSSFNTTASFYLLIALLMSPAGLAYIFATMLLY